jgi:hypothetical protein
MLHPNHLMATNDLIGLELTEGEPVSGISITLEHLIKIMGREGFNTVRVLGPNAFGCSNFAANRLNITINDERIITKVERG